MDTHAVTASIEFQMSLLLFVSLAGYLIASRIGQPAVVGQIVVGLVVGPSVLGWITYTDFISSVGHLGAVILLFVIGLEFKLKDIARIKYLVIALFGVLVPWISGYYLATAFGFESHRAAIVGVALSATSIAITADTLKELGKLKTSAAKAIIGAAIIDDVLALLALSFANQFSAPETSHITLVWISLKAFGFIIVGAFVGQVLMTRIMLRIDHSPLVRQYPELVFIFTMMVAFLYAMLAELMGLSAIVGAFIAGVSLSTVNLTYGKQFREGAEYLRIIFASIFFVSLGVLVDIRAITPDIIGFIAALTLAGILSKIIGCGLPARLSGLDNREAIVVGIGMTPRGEVSAIVALLALTQGIIEQPLYVSLLMMSLLTTAVAPILLRKLVTKLPDDIQTGIQPLNK